MEMDATTYRIFNYSMIFLMLAAFYIVVIRPQKKDREKRNAMLGTLHKGNKVLTVGGIYGEIINIKDNVIDLKIADKVIIKVTKGAVQKNISQGKGEDKTDKAALDKTINEEAEK